MSITTYDTSSYIQEDTAHLSAHIVKREIFDANVIKSLLIDERFADIDRKLLKKYYKMRKGPNETSIIYNFGKGYETLQLGRIYPDYGLGLANFSKDIRNPLAAKYYWDIDIENAHYIIALKLAEDRNLKCESIKYYVENRNKCLAEVSSDRYIAKTAFLKILYGGDISLYDKYDIHVKEPDGDLTLLYSIKYEVEQLMNHLYFEFENIRKHCLRKKNPRASLMSIVLQDIERHILLCLDKYFILNGRSMDVLIHDGGFVRKLDGETAFPLSLLQSAQEYVCEETGYNIILANKPITYTYELKTEVLYICEGVTVESFNNRKIEFEREHFYLRENGTICEIKSDGTLLMMNHDHAMRNFANMAFEYRRDNILKRVPFLQLWLSSPDRKEYNKLVYRPNGNVADDEFNTFIPLRGCQIDSSGGDAGLSRFLDIALNLAKGCIEHRDYILKWIALKIQKPWTIPGVCLVFTGPQGVGKSLFWEFIGRKIIGSEQFVYTDNIARDIFDTYSEAQMSNLFCLMDEASSNLTRKMANELKAKITAKMARINPKDIRPFSIDVFMSWVLLTNDISPVKLESGDRRYAVFYTGSEHKGDFNYWSETAKLFEDDNTVGGVFKYLSELDVSDFIVNDFPVTELRELMIDNEKPAEESFLLDMAKNLNGDEWRGSRQEFYKLYVDWCDRFEMRPKSAVGFGREMTSFVIKQLVSNWGSHGNYGKIIHLNKIRDIYG